MSAAVKRVINGLETLWWMKEGEIDCVHVCPFKGNTLLVVTVERFTPRDSVTKALRKLKVNWGTWGPETPERVTLFIKALLLAIKIAGGEVTLDS